MLKQISIETNSRFIALIIGQAGIGKTSLLRSIDESEPIFCVSAEAGLLCVRDLVASKRVQGVEVSTFAELAEVYSFLVSPAAAGFKWVFIDSLTEISARCLDGLKVKFPDRKDSFSLWGSYADQMVSMIKGFRDLPAFNVIFTCLSSEEKDEVNRRYVGPCISGASVKERLTSFFDLVAFMTTMPDSNGKEQRVLVTQPMGCFPAKDRSGLLSPVEPPHLGAIKAKILGGI